MVPGERLERPGNMDELRWFLPGEPGELRAPTPIPVPANPGLRPEL